MPKNLSDGSVEVVAVGDAHAIDALVRWLACGPPLAEVSDVQGFAVMEPDGGDDGFAVL